MQMISTNRTWSRNAVYACGRYFRRIVPLTTVVVFAFGIIVAGAAHAEAVLDRFLPQVSASDFVSDADGFGGKAGNLPVVGIMRDSEIIGYLFVTSDFVGTTGYSGKPIHVMVVVSTEGEVLSAKLIEHAEPIVLIGIPEDRIREVIDGYARMDLVMEAGVGGSGHDVDIVSGATVTIMVIDDSIVRSGIKVARALGLGGLASLEQALEPTRRIDPDADAPANWSELTGDGSVRRLVLDVGQINNAFRAGENEAAAVNGGAANPSDIFIDLETALISVPAIGRTLLGEAEFDNLAAWLAPGEHAILVAGKGRYSFKGSGYVRGGIFDRIQLIQGDNSVRFRDRMHRRVGAIALADAPTFDELDVFKIPADAGFDPTAPWRLQLLVQRAVGAVEKTYRTFDLSYVLPDKYTEPIPGPSVVTARADVDEASAKHALWKRIWLDNTYRIAAVLGMLLILTAAFFFQMFMTRNERTTFWFRNAFLVVTLVFLGWYANAQLSVVNLMALGNALVTGFSWDAFLLDPVVFILWFSVAASLLFWGRGAYCGWLCPFGALQELTNRIAKYLRVPQIKVPWGLHERLWPIKYIFFLGLFGISLASLPLAEQFAEIEPFKTAIILKFQRTWPFVAFALAVLAIGLFIERFYCRYLCPLGAALAIPGRLRMFDWLKRYHECGNPCQTCRNECMVQAIHPTGEINPNECLYCLHCQVRYQDDHICPVRIKLRRRRERFLGTAASDGESHAAHSHQTPQPETGEMR